MYLIIGLGNPGQDYAKTRHNFGRLVLNHLAERWDSAFAEQKKLGAALGFIEYGEQKIILCQPLTYMNESGLPVKAVAKFYKIPSKNILVIYDDLDLELGRIKISINTASGGHNGIKSIIQHLGQTDFARLRLGIGPQKGGAEKFVLQKFNAAETKKLDAIVDRATDCAATYITEGLVKAASKFN